MRDRRSGTTRAGQRGHRRHPGQRRQLLARRSAPTGATWPSCRTRRTWSPATRTTHRDVFVRDLRSGTTGGSAWPATAPRPTAYSDLARRSAPTGATWPSSRTRRTSSPATRTTRLRTCSCATCGRAPPSGSAWPPTAPRATATALSRRSAPTGATWPSSRTRRTSFPATRTALATCSCAIGGRAPPERVSVATDGTQANATAA